MPKQPRSLLRPTHLLYRAHHGVDPLTGPARCWLCGAPCAADGPAANDVVRSTFNDHARARQGGDSDVCCQACAWYLDYKVPMPGSKRDMGFFTKSIRATPNSWQLWDRETMADDCLAWLADGLPNDSLLVLNFSKQKHVVPWARVSPKGTRQPWIDTDQGRVTLSANLPLYLGAIARLWIAGHRKGDIARAQPTPIVLSRRGFAGTTDLRDLANLVIVAGTLLMDLCTYLVTETNRDRLADRYA